MHRRTRFITLAAAVVVAAVPSAAQATTVSCGDHITTSIVVDNDLTCSGTALIVDANNITIDLGGHTLQFGGRETSNAKGVLVYKHSDVRIKDGTINDFETGIHLLGDGNVVSRVVTRRGDTGVWAKGEANEVYGARMYEPDHAGVRTDGDYGVVDTTRVFGKPGVTEFGIVVSGPKNVVSESLATSAAFGISITGDDASVTNSVAYYNSQTGIEMQSPFGVLTGNTANHNGGSGIFASNKEGTAESNTANDNGGSGLVLTEDQVLVTGNAAYENKYYGIFASSNPLDGGGNVAAGNGTQCSAGIAC